MNPQLEFPLFKHLSPEQIETVRLINRMYSKEAKGPQPATGKVLHFWGQFTSELPPQFQPNGETGHQYIECSTKEAAEVICQELRSCLRNQWPDLIEWAGEGWYRWMIHDTRQMTLTFEKKKK